MDRAAAAGPCRLSIWHKGRWPHVLAEIAICMTTSLVPHHQRNLMDALEAMETRHTINIIIAKPALARRRLRLQFRVGRDQGAPIDNWTPPSRKAGWRGKKAGQSRPVQNGCADDVIAPLICIISVMSENSTNNAIDAIIQRENLRRIDAGFQRSIWRSVRASGRV